MAEVKEKVMEEKRLYSTLVSALNNVKTLPDAGDFPYLKTLADFNERQNEICSQLAEIIEDASAGVGEQGQKLTNHDILGFNDHQFEVFEPIQDAIDSLLESVDEALVEAKTESTTQTKDDINGSKIPNLIKNVAVMTDMKKPQEKYAWKVDNTNEPFSHNLTDKLNAKIPLEMGTSEETADEDESYNPYEFEIRDWVKNRPNWLFENEMELSRPLEVLKQNTADDLTWVDSPEILHQMISKIKEETIIAVDLENHSYRSFKGFLCLMQISTKSEDFLVDTLVLRDQMHELLDVFTNPSIAKLFHGSDFDIQWLQRDFNLYVVGLVDTGQCARLLNYSSAGLAYSLQKHCKVSVNKAYQLADWRIRPLTDEMTRYSREDTRFLLYVFQQQRKELLERGLLQEALSKSAAIASSTYKPSLLFEDSAKSYVLKKNLKIFGKSLKIFIEVYNWRDRKAREHDESTEYILPIKSMIAIAIAEPSSVAILRECGRLPKSFTLFDQFSNEIVEIVNKTVKETEDSTSSLSKNEVVANQTVFPTHKRFCPDISADYQNSVGDEGRGSTSGDENWASLEGFSFEKSAFNESSKGYTDLWESMQQVNKVSPFCEMADTMKIQYKQRKSKELANKSVKFEDYVLELDLQADENKLCETNVAQAMAEIYRVSNSNRKTNKEKKKIKKEQPEGASLEAPSASYDSSSIFKLLGQGDAEDVQNQNAKRLTNVSEFLSELDWLKPPEQVSKSLTIPGLVSPKKLQPQVTYAPHLDIDAFSKTPRSRIDSASSFLSGNGGRPTGGSLGFNQSPRLHSMPQKHLDFNFSPRAQRRMKSSSLVEPMPMQFELSQLSQQSEEDVDSILYGDYAERHSYGYADPKTYMRKLPKQNPAYHSYQDYPHSGFDDIYQNQNLSQSYARQGSPLVSSSIHNAFGAGNVDYVDRVSQSQRPERTSNAFGGVSLRSQQSNGFRQANNFSNLNSSLAGVSLRNENNNAFGLGSEAAPGFSGLNRTVGSPPRRGMSSMEHSFDFNQDMGASSLFTHSPLHQFETRREEEDSGSNLFRDVGAKQTSFSYF